MQNSSLSLTIAGGWYWCQRCQVHHMECSVCPDDPDYVPEDPAVMSERLKKAIEVIRLSEETCRCVAVGRQSMKCNPCLRAEAKRNWPTGGYYGTCFECKLTFTGPKRASFCNVCRSPDETHSSSSS